MKTWMLIFAFAAIPIGLPFEVPLVQLLVFAALLQCIVAWALTKNPLVGFVGASLILLAAGTLLVALFQTEIFELAVRLTFGNAAGILVLTTVIGLFKLDSNLKRMRKI